MSHVSYFLSLFKLWDFRSPLNMCFIVVTKYFVNRSDSKIFEKGNIVWRLNWDNMALERATCSPIYKISQQPLAKCTPLSLKCEKSTFLFSSIDFTSLLKFLNVEDVACIQRNSRLRLTSWKFQFLFILRRLELIPTLIKRYGIA